MFRSQLDVTLTVGTGFRSTTDLIMTLCRKLASYSLCSLTMWGVTEQCFGTSVCHNNTCRQISSYLLSSIPIFIWSVAWFPL